MSTTSTAAKLKSEQGRLSDIALQKLATDLPWYRSLEAEQRIQLDTVAERGIAQFVTWFETPSEPTWVLDDVFGPAPTDLSRVISLQRALQLIRIVVGVVEDRVPELAAPREQVPLREAVLVYSREVAFAAADVYARAAERRGAWDSRLEAQAIDALLRAEDADAIRSRLSAVGWRSRSHFCVVAGYAPRSVTAALVRDLRRAAVRLARDCVVGIQGDRLILLLGGLTESASDTFAGFGGVSEFFGSGPVVHGPVVGTFESLPTSAHAAVSGLSAAPAWPDAPRPVAADALLPERALNQDPDSLRTLEHRYYAPLTAGGSNLVDTLESYLGHAHALEATARDLRVHANTVRYRLKRIHEVTGLDPLVPREALTLRFALIAGRLPRRQGDGAGGSPDPPVGH
ncbi:CdaR family transcriptional regulator [Galactobacter sp.]|uniref:PucR family transcriptional regulator n=1 Tax=Galactobacter sp. TaxID=2676125 RepID=UPI0025BBFC5F|nr:helix-turn-helix domain-containing protein [Galactobacter sp.]